MFRILVTVSNRPLAPGQYNRLMDRLGFKDRNIINFTEFFSSFREATANGYPKWMDPVQRQWQERANMSASQVHLHLKEKAKQRYVLEMMLAYWFTMLSFDIDVLVALFYHGFGCKETPTRCP